MVEISLYGSGEGPGWVTAPGYSTAAFSPGPKYELCQIGRDRGKKAPRTGAISSPTPPACAWGALCGAREPDCARRYACGARGGEGLGVGWMLDWAAR